MSKQRKLTQRQINARKKREEAAAQYLVDKRFPMREPKESYKHYIERLNSNPEYVSAYKEFNKKRGAKALKARRDAVQFDPNYDYDSDMLPITLEDFQVIQDKYAGKNKNKRYVNSWIDAVGKRDLAYNPNLLLKKNAQALAKRKKGRAYYGDVNNDDIPDVTVYDKYGKIVAFNGYQPKKSRHGLNMDYLAANPNVTKITKRDVDNYMRNKTTGMNANQLKELNKKLKRAGLMTYKVVEKRITLAQLLQSYIKQIYDIYDGKAKELIPFTTYKSLFTRAFLNTIFDVDSRTLSTDPLGKRITLIVNKKDKKGYDTFNTLRTNITGLFKNEILPKQNSILKTVNSKIINSSVRYGIGTDAQKRVIMKDISDAFKVILSGKGELSRQCVSIINSCRHLLEMNVSSDSDTSTSTYNNDYDEDSLMDLTSQEE